MSRLTQCKDCGHTVDKKAKVCPSCGVNRPGQAPLRLRDLAVLGMFVFLAVKVFVFLTEIRGPEPLSEPRPRPQPATAERPARTYTDAEIRQAVEKSDDFDRYSEEFEAAARRLLTTRQCGLFEMTEYGGFVKSTTTYQDQPVYVTYCGGRDIENRIYFNVESLEIFE